MGMVLDYAHAVAALPQLWQQALNQGCLATARVASYDEYGYIS